MQYKHFLYLGSIVLASFLYADKKPSLSHWYKKVEQQCLASLHWEDEDWPNESFYDYLVRSMDYQRNPQEAKRRRSAFKIVTPTVQHLHAHDVLDDPVTWQDLSLFCGHADPSCSLLSIINRTSTELGKVSLAYMLVQPQADLRILTQRQQVLKTLLEDHVLYGKLTAVLEQFKKVEPLVLSFWLRDNFKHAAEKHYYSFPESVSRFNIFLNNNSLALDIKSVLEHAKRSLWFVSTAVAAGVLPLYGLMQMANMTTKKSVLQQMLDDLKKSPIKQEESHKIIQDLKYVLTHEKKPMLFEQLAHELKGSGGPALALISMLVNNNYVRGGASMVAGAYCALSAKEDFEWARDHIVLDMYLQEKMIAVATGLQALETIDDLIKSCDIVRTTLTLSDKVSDFLYVKPQQSSDLHRLLELLKTTTFSGDASPLSRTGRVLVAYALMHSLKQEWVRALSAIGELDAYLSIVRLYKEFEKKRCNFCFVDFKESKTPYLAIENFWNPFIDVQEAVTNSLQIGGSERLNVILTGPNAGGKSTILRGIGINVLLGQTFGVAAATSMEMTPFSAIATYFNIADDISSGTSMFKAEALRAHYLLHKIENLEPGKFSFIIADELFKGSSPKEEEAAAYSMAKYLGTFNNSISILATHFPMLTQLELNTRVFKNYKVSVRIDETGNLYYPFILEPGLSNQHIALDVLRAEGFTSSILDEACDIVKSTSVH